jgi:hypothetical protein
MNSTTSFTQRIVAGPSTCLRVLSAVVVSPSVPALADANPAFGGGNQFGTGMNSNHMNTAWLGDSAETGCVKTTYVTKRITAGSLREVLT